MSAMRVAGLSLLKAGLALFAALTAAAPLPALADAPFLWSLRNGDVTHYLQGSVHLLPEAAHPLPSALEAAYANAEELVFEADIEALSAPDNQLALMNAARAPQGLRARLPASLYTRLQQQAQRVGLPLAMCEPFKAWFCALSLEVFSYQQAGFSPELGLDQHYYHRARDDGKTLAALETVEAHLGLFSAMSDAQAQTLLEQSLAGDGIAAPDPQALYRSWRNNDHAALERLVADMRRSAPEIYERLLAARNRAWVALLRPRLRGERPQLIIVGAAHLVGDDGLIALLAAEGLRLQPVAVGARAPEPRAQ